MKSTTVPASATIGPMRAPRSAPATPLRANPRIPTNTGIAKRLYLSERTVVAHVRHVFGKLDVPESEDDHRRVRAVLTHLSATQA